MSSKDFGLGPKWWQRPENKLKKCSERTSNWCDPTETDGCCAVIPCMYCLELEIYGQGVQYGESNFGTMGWSGSVGGGTFFGFWEVGQYSGECEFVVHWNGEEVYRKGCEDGQSCRDSSDEAEVVIDYEDATLRWVKHEYRPLPYVKDPDTNCTIHFCGDCECTCECLCVVLTESNGTQHREEFCDSAYDECIAPVWEGTVGNKSVRLSLARDEYTGQCVVLVGVDGEDYDPIVIGDCKTLSGTVILPDYSELSFSCKKCGCEKADGCPCCPGWPLERSADIYFASIEESISDCGSIIALQEYSDTFGCTGTSAYPVFQNVGNLLYVRVICDPETLAWVVEYKSLATGMVANNPETGTWVPVVYDFTCPDCADAVDGVAHGSFDFIAIHACETSGGTVSFNVLVHADIEVQCV